jgi:hypothetical protein
VTRFVAGPGLNERVAAGPGRRRVDALTRACVDFARVYAPPAKVWVTAHDERVRPTHRDADRQQIPGNLRYVLAIPGKDGAPSGRSELAAAPRDPNLTAANRFGCRCLSIELPGIIAAAIRVSTTVHGTTITGRVSVHYPRVPESNNPSPPDSGGGWLNRALRQAARAGR